MVADVSCSSLFVHFVPAGRFDFAFISSFVLLAIERILESIISNPATRNAGCTRKSSGCFDVTRGFFVSVEIGVVATVNTTGSAGIEFLLDSIALDLLELWLIAIVTAFL
jgi:hypothetical protein